MQGGWFLWDFSFYGNKVFQSSFIKILSPDATILVNLLWTLLNSGVALVGYWCAAAVIDNVRVGRLRLQLLGFAMVSSVFIYERHSVCWIGCCKAIFHRCQCDNRIVGSLMLQLLAFAKDESSPEVQRCS